MIGGSVLAFASAKPVHPPEAAPGAPNIVVITTDDQNAGTINARTMPLTTRLIKSRGVNFSDFVVTTPQCCPSRAAYFTGQYGHNNGVLSNDDGYPALIDRANMLPAWLQQAGYRTAHIGRFLHDYAKAPGVGDASEPPPGWDAWAGVEGVRYFDYGISYNGIKAKYGRRPSDYSTTVFTRAAVEVVDWYAPKPAPLYLNVAYVAPHKERRRAHSGYCGGSITPAPRDAGLFRTASLPRVPSIDEADVSDKPPFIRHSNQLDDKYAKTLRAYRCGLAALREVDRGVGRIVDAFRAAGELDNTVFFFTSDNGRFEGEHRLPGGKSFPYEEALKVPLAVRLPRAMGGKEGRTGALAANIDLAPTILQLAHAMPCLLEDCRVLDGRSLMPLLTGRGRWPGDRAVAIELREPPGQVEGRLPCAYQGVRTRRDVYVHYTRVRDPHGDGCVPSDEYEYYNLEHDPYELRNLAGRPEMARRQNQLDWLLGVLAGCNGLPGDRPPSSVPYCG